jgi:hypothetical protein
MKKKKNSKKLKYININMKKKNNSKKLKYSYCKKKEI